MTKKKTSKKGVKKVKKVAKAQKKIATATGNNMMGAYMGLAMQACSISNPFCPEAIGARWPDGSHAKSAGWSIPGDIFTFNSDANGVNAVLFFPNGCYKTAVTPVVGFNPDYSVGNTVLVKTFPSDVGRWRLTSWGLEISSLQSKMNAAGNVNIRLFSPANGSTLVGTSLFSTAADAVYDVPVSRLIEKSLYIVSAPLGTESRLFNNASELIVGPVSGYTNPGWQYIQVGISGAAVGVPVINVRCFYHFEFVFADGSTSTVFARKPPLKNETIQDSAMNAVDGVGSFIEGTVQRVDSMFKSKTMQYLTAGAAALMTRNPAPLLMLTNGVGGRQNAKYVD